VSFLEIRTVCGAEKTCLWQERAVLVWLLAIGITLPIAGLIIITILDRSQITKRKQFDDFVDLIYWI
jgi:hypothetical protein